MRLPRIPMVRLYGQNSLFRNHFHSSSPACSTLADHKVSLESNPVSKFKTLIQRFYAEENVEGYIASNNYIYRERLWKLYKQLPPGEVLSCEQYMVLLKIAPFTRTSPTEQIARTKEIIELMLEQGFSPGEPGLLALLYAFQRSPDASEQIDHLLQTWSHSPTQTKSVYHVLLQVYAKRVGTEKAEQWFDSRIGTVVYSDWNGKQTLRPLVKDESVYGQLIKHYSAERKLGLAVQKFRELHQSRPRYPVRSLNRVIYGFAKAGDLKAAVAWYYAARSFNIEPDRLTFETILSAVYRLHKDECIIPTVSDLEGMMKEMGIKNPLNESPRPNVHRPAFKEKRGKVALKSHLPLPVSAQDDLPLTESSPENATKAFSRNSFMPSSDPVDVSKRSLALDIFEDMIRAGIIPGLQTFNVFLSAYLQAKEDLAVVKLFEFMKTKLDIYADAGTYSIMMKAYSRLGRHNQAIEIIHELDKNDIEPDMVMYATIMDAYARARKYDEALRTFKMIEESGLRPSLRAMQILLHTHCMR